MALNKNRIRRLWIGLLGMLAASFALMLGVIATDLGHAIAQAIRRWFGL